MWLLRLHFQISVLCALVIFGALFIFWHQIIENGWAKGDGKKRGLLARFVRFLRAVCLFLIVSVVPVINIATVWKIWEMATKKKECRVNDEEMNKEAK